VTCVKKKGGEEGGALLRKKEERERDISGRKGKEEKLFLSMGKTI